MEDEITVDEDEMLEFIDAEEYLTPPLEDRGTVGVAPEEVLPPVDDKPQPHVDSIGTVHTVPAPQEGGQPLGPSLPRRRRSHACILSHCPTKSLGGLHSALRHFEDAHMPIGPRTDTYFVNLFEELCAVFGAQPGYYHGLAVMAERHRLLTTGWSINLEAWDVARGFASFLQKPLPSLRASQDAFQRGQIIHEAFLTFPRVLAVIFSFLTPEQCAQVRKTPVNRPLGLNPLSLLISFYCLYHLRKQTKSPTQNEIKLQKCKQS